MFTFTEGERGFGQNGPFLLGFLLTMNLRIPPHLCPLPRSGGEEMPKSHRRNGMRSPTHEPLASNRSHRGDEVAGQNPIVTPGATRFLGAIRDQKCRGFSPLGGEAE